MNTPLQLYDYKPETDGALKEILNGLQKPRKELPCKFFYDEIGSRLFEQISKLEEYYPTRTEVAIMQDNMSGIVSCFRDGSLLIEFGSGSSQKTRMLLNHLANLSAYIPIDISRDFLLHSASVISSNYPELQVLPVCADYQQHFELPVPQKLVSQKVVYFPGSTIGNFHYKEALEFLKNIAEICGSGGGLLIGVDLKKDPGILHRAYNDKKGITANFNLNVLRHINREYDADFDLEQFRHIALYNEEASRVEMHLESLSQQKVQINGNEVYLKSGERIWTESCYKYSLEEFSLLAGEVGFTVSQIWTDERQMFSVQFLTVQE